MFHRLFKIDPSERISIQELLYHPWLNRVHLYPWIPSPTFQIASLIKPFYLDPWKCFAEITAISYLKNGNCFRYKVQSTLELQHRSIKNESQKHHESSKKDSSGSVLGLVSADTASFEDIALHHIEDFNGGSTSKKASRSFSTEFVSKASGPLAYVGHFLSSWTFSLDQYPSTVHEATITGQSTSLHNLFRFGKKEKLKYSVLEGSSKLEALLKILNISFDTWVITRTKIIPRNTMGKKENSSFLPIENENDITAFLFKCQYETSLGEIYVFEVYLECASRLSYLLDSVPKFIVRPFTRSTNSSTFNSQSSFCPSDDSTASSIYPQTQVNALTTMQYKLFVPKDMPQTFLSKFEILLWKQFIMERMKT